MTKYWIGVASREHVMKGKAEGFAQVCHGKQGPLKRMQPGDWIIYYSPTEIYGEKNPYRKFTAIGQITDDEPYRCAMNPNFIPWRRNVNFIQAKEVDITPLIDTLFFIKNKQHWGFVFRYELFEVPEEDFLTIASRMRITRHE